MFESTNHTSESLDQATGLGLPPAVEILAMTKTEIDVRRRHGAEYGHVGFVLSVAAKRDKAA